jgi:hypothetical protein
MSDDDRPTDGTDEVAPLADLIQGLSDKLDTVAGATAAVASTQTDLLTRLAEAEVRRSEDASNVAQRLDALERQVLARSQPTGDATDAPAGSLEPLAQGLAELTAAAASQRDDAALALDVLARMAESLERSDARTEDRLAAVRDAAAVPVADLQALVTARADRTDAQLALLATTVEGSLDAPAGDHGDLESRSRLSALADLITARVDELGEAVRSLSWQLPEITQELGALRDRFEANDVSGAIVAASEDLTERLTLHTDTALAGVLRLLDERLNALRASIAQAASTPSEGASSSMGFEAGAVMGAAQAAWNRLEQRLDNEFDDLGRQLLSMGTVIEQALATAEAAANRPVVTGDQLRRAASSVKDTVLGASRSRRDRRGGPRGLGPGGGS